jgi:predicted anti-sigma-YlaC factor YlaD
MAKKQAKTKFKGLFKKGYDKPTGKDDTIKTRRELVEKRDPWLSTVVAIAIVALAVIAWNRLVVGY